MNQEKWEIVKQCANVEPLPSIPVGLIVDSPWIPGYLGISTLDYMTMPDVWLDANLKVEAAFPDVIFLPGFWAEMGMAAEPSGFGCKLSFFQDKTPNVYPLTLTSKDVKDLKQPNPLSAGVMPLILNFYRNVESKVIAAGHQIKVVASRGPLATASHVMGMTPFLMGMKLDPDNIHHFLQMTTTLTLNWLEAQADVLHDVEGIMLLDDIVGFISEEDFLEFAHPYFKQIFDHFPGTVKFFHNDMDNTSNYPYMKDWPVQILNFTHLQDIAYVRELVGPDVCLMGNVPPLSVLTTGTADETYAAAAACIQNHPGKAGLMLSAGGGVSPGTPGENIEALIRAAQSV